MSTEEHRRSGLSRPLPFALAQFLGSCLSLLWAACEPVDTSTDDDDDHVAQCRSCPADWLISTQAEVEAAAQCESIEGSPPL